MLIGSLSKRFRVPVKPLYYWPVPYILDYSDKWTWGQSGYGQPFLWVSNGQRPDKTPPGTPSGVFTDTFKPQVINEVPHTCLLSIICVKCEGKCEKKVFKCHAFPEALQWCLTKKTLRRKSMQGIVPCLHTCCTIMNIRKGQLQKVVLNDVRLLN